jgi:hypothetical protein
MQKLLLSICLLAAVVFVSAQRTATKRTSSKSGNHSNAVKLGVNTFFDTDEFPFNIAWETKVGTNESIQIGMLPRFSKYNEEKTSGIGISIAYRKYISKNRTGIQGLFFSPIVKVGFLQDNYAYRSYNYTGNPPQPQYYIYSRKSRVNQYNIGAVFGHKWAYRSGFTFEVSGGMGYFNTKDSYEINNNGSGTASTFKETYNRSGILPQLQLSFGHAF